MKKKLLEIVLWIMGLSGFFLLMGGVGGIEIDSMSLGNGTITATIGLIILAIVVFLGIPHYEEMSQKKL